MKKQDLKIGMSLFSCMGIRGRYTGIKEYKVKSIGVKYFYVEGIDEKFNISNLKHEEKDYWQWNIQLYTSAKEIEDYQETKKLKREIDGFFIFSPQRELSIDELRSIHQIIFPK
jgi:hypothetical protein